jgi:hypothetical protein
MPSGTVIERYLSWQASLARDGCTRHAESLFFQLCREIEADPFLDGQGFQSVLERLHCAAFPQASTRPPRLTAGEIPDIRE